MPQLFKELSLIMKISQLFGVFHGFVVNNHTLHMSKTSKLLLLFYLTTYTVAVLEITKSFYNQKSAVAAMLFITILNAFNTFQMLVVNFLQKENLSNVLQKLMKIDLSGFKGKNKYNVIKYTFAFLGYAFVTTLVSNLSRIAKINSTIELIIWKIFITITAAVNVLTEIQFVTIVLLIYQRFKQINDILEDFSNSKKYLPSKYFCLL